MQWPGKIGAKSPSAMLARVVRTTDLEPMPPKDVSLGELILMAFETRSFEAKLAPKRKLNNRVKLPVNSIRDFKQLAFLRHF